MRRKNLSHLFTFYAHNEKEYPRDAIRMMFVSNHDKNSWEGTEYEQFADGVETAIVLSVVGEGMPLIYNGQEAGLNRRLAFFERDPIEWKSHPTGEFYRKLFALKHENTALWNGHWGARMIQIPNSAHLKVLSFVRQNEKDKVFAVLNFSAQPQTVMFRKDLYHGEYTDFFNGERVSFDGSTQMSLNPWGYKVFVK